MKKFLSLALSIALFASCSESAKNTTTVDEGNVTATILMSNNVAAVKSNSPMRAAAQNASDTKILTSFPVGVETVNVINTWGVEVSSKNFAKASKLEWSGLHLGENVFTATATTTTPAYGNIFKASIDDTDNSISNPEYRTYKGELADENHEWYNPNRIFFAEKNESFRMHMKCLNSMFIFDIDNKSKEGKTVEIVAKVGDKSYPAVVTPSGKYVFNTVDLVAGVKVQFFATVKQTVNGVVSELIKDKKLIADDYIIDANKKYTFKNPIVIDDSVFPVFGTFTITWEDWTTVVIDNNVIGGDDWK